MTLNTPAHSLLAPIRAGWNLGNSLDAMKRGLKPGEYVLPRETETAWRNPPVTRSLIHSVCNAGFGSVRVPVTWIQHLNDEGKVDPRWMDRVAEVVHWVLDEGMLCLLNVHHDAGCHGWLQATDESYTVFGERFEKLWKQIASRFADEGERLVFEALNELLDGRGHWTQTENDSAYDIHNRWNQLFVDVVRSTGGNNATRVLSLQTYSAGHSARTLAAFRMPEDTVSGRIILQVHNYDPQGFCWLRAENHEIRNTWGTEADLNQIDMLMTALSAFAEKHQAPVIIGEFGSEDKQNTDERLRHAAYVAGKAREKGIVCFWWDCGYFALFDRHTGKLIQPGITGSLLCR